MSVYSGFSTRQQELAYSRLTETLLLLLQDRLLTLHRRGEESQAHWLERFLDVYSRMTRLEMHKYFPPKLTRCVRELAKVYGVPEWDEPIHYSERKPRRARRVHKPFASVEHSFFAVLST